MNWADQWGKGTTKGQWKRISILEWAKFYSKEVIWITLRPPFYGCKVGGVRKWAFWGNSCSTLHYYYYYSWIFISFRSGIAVTRGHLHLSLLWHFNWITKARSNTRAHLTLFTLRGYEHRFIQKIKFHVMNDQKMILSTLHFIYGWLKVAVTRKKLVFSYVWEDFC